MGREHKAQAPTRLTGTVTGARRGRGRGVSVSGYSRTRRVDHPERVDGAVLPEPVPESALYRPVAEALNAQGFSCWRDVSYLGSWIDLYARSDDGRSVAVELKVMDWHRAYKQALRLRNAADEVYIAVWAPFVHRCLTPEARQLLESAGIGIVSVNGVCAVKLKASKRRPRYTQHVILPGRASHRAR